MLSAVADTKLGFWLGLITWPEIKDQDLLLTHELCLDALLSVHEETAAYIGARRLTHVEAMCLRTSSASSHCAWQGWPLKSCICGELLCPPVKTQFTPETPVSSRLTKPLYAAFVPTTLPVVAGQTWLYLAHTVFLQSPEPCLFLWPT